MIKVLQVYDSIAVSSGISNVIMSWIQNVDISQVSMDVLACWRKEPNYSEIIESNGGKVFFIEKTDHISNYISFINKVYEFFSEHAKDYDIVHLHSSIFSFPILFAAKKYGIKRCIVHVHSTVLGNTRLSALRNRVTLLPMKLSKPEYWSCSKEAARAWYDKAGIHKYTIVNNGIELDKFLKNERTRAEYRKKWGASERTVLIGHISNMTPVKNVPFVLNIAEKLINNGCNIKVILIGKDELPEEIKESITKKRLEQFVINAGVRNDIYNCVQAFDICLMPSLSEGYGLVPIEVQAAGIPVILSEGFPSIIANLPLSFPLTLSEEKWTELCEQLIENSEDVQNMYNPTLYKQFDIKEISSNVIDKYKKMMEESGNE